MQRTSSSCLHNLARLLLGMLIGLVLASSCLVAGTAAYFTYLDSQGDPTAKTNFPLDLPFFPSTASAPVVQAKSVGKLETATPFQPNTWTPEPSATATLTVTPTPTFTNTPEPTSTPTATATPTEIPTDTSVPPTETPSDGLPESATVGYLEGHDQTLPLSCESRSAVDWADFFGVSVDEMTFQYALPITDNPNTGFVGDPRSDRGQTPPYPYGVHAPPVAKLLRDYGLNAQSMYGMDYQTIRREIAAGRPVIVWVIGHVWMGYGGIQYTASDGETMIVAPFEHTVIVTAYDAETVTVVDGYMRYEVNLANFLDSWSVLGYQGILLTE